MREKEKRIIDLSIIDDGDISMPSITFSKKTKLESNDHSLAMALQLEEDGHSGMNEKERTRTALSNTWQPFYKT